MAFDRLIENIVKMQNPTVAGLDPKLDYVPESIKTKCFEKYGKTLEGAAAALFEFNKALIDALYDIVPAVKPQAAYYEMYGWQGVKALCDTIAYAKSKGMFVITDGKRNDIGTTMEAYATAHLGHTDVAGESIDAFGADALTVNGYLGTDGIKPLAKICDSDDKGIFVLVKTSNPSSGELQDMKLETNESVYEHMGKMCEGWGEDLMGKHGYSAVGAVVGATYPEQLGEMRAKLPHTFFLVPGYGAQGGGADDVKNAFDENGLGAIINSSRGIMCAWKKQGLTEDDFAAETRHSISMLIFNSLYTNSPITNAYTAAITPASVGVNLPLRSPTRINTGRINAQSPSSNAFATCFADCLSAFARLSFFAIKNHNTHKAPDKYTAGAIPPINNFVTETPACTPKIIIGTDGGMIGDKIFPAAISPVQVSRL